MAALFCIFPVFWGTAQQSNTSVSAILHTGEEVRTLFRVISFPVMSISLLLWTSKIKLCFGRCVGKGCIF